MAAPTDPYYTPSHWDQIQHQGSAGSSGATEVRFAAGAWPARPSTSGPVTWIGPQSNPPAAMVDGDEWVAVANTRTVWTGAPKPLMSRPWRLSSQGLAAAGARVMARWRESLPLGAGIVIAEWTNAHSPASARVAGLPGGHSGAGGYDDPGQDFARVRLAIETDDGRIIPFYPERASAAPDQEASPDNRLRTALAAPGETIRWQPQMLDLQPRSLRTDDCWVRLFIEPADASGAYLATGQVAQQHDAVASRGEFTAVGSGQVDQTLATGSISATGGATISSTGSGPQLVQVRAVDPFGDDTIAPYNRGVVAAVGDSIGTGYIATALNDQWPMITVARATETGASFAAFDDRTEYRRRTIRGATHATVMYFTNDLTSAVTVTQLQTWANQIATGLRRYGVQKIAWATLLPMTLSSDGYTTLAGQTLNMAANQRGPQEQVAIDWNNLLRSGAPIAGTSVATGGQWYLPPSGLSVDAVIDMAPAVTVMDGGFRKWRVDQGGVLNSLDGTGLHPSDLAVSLLAAVVNANQNWFLI